LRLDAGAFDSVTVDMQQKSVSVRIVNKVGAGAAAPNGRLVVGQSNLKPTDSLEMDGGAWVVTFENGAANINLA